ncbi:MAG: hypothetical protein ABEK50_00635 [bacterium]
MDTFRLKYAVVLTVLVGLLVASLPAFAGGGHGGNHSFEDTGPYAISVQTHPEASKIVPDKNLVETIVSVTHNGKPAEDVTLSYRLDAPPKRFWFGTDFPVVEGTPLLQGTVDVRNGSQMYELVYPIRGNYTLRAKVTGPEGTSRKEFTVGVSENPQEKINLAIFLFVLFLIGGLGGYFLTAGTGRESTTAVILLVGLGLLAFNPGSALAHGKGAYNPDKLQQRIGTEGLTDQFDLNVRTFPEPVRVGEMLNVRFEVNKKDDHGRHNHEGAGDYRADVSFIHSAGGKTFVAQPVSLSEGRASFQVQLFDGAPHYMLTKVYRSTDPRKDHGDQHGHGEAPADEPSGHKDEHTPEAGHGSKENAHGSHDDHDHDKESDQENEEHGHEKAAGEETGGHAHGHGPSRPWEWQGQLDLPAGSYTIKFGESGDPAMRWLLLPRSTEHLEEHAVRAMENTCRSVSPGTSISPDEACYNLTLNDDGTTHKLTVKNGGTFRLFTQHLPAEFNMRIKNANGKTVTVDREFYPGKGELVLTDIRKIDVQPVQPPVDDIVKVMLTLIGVAGLGFLAAWRLKVAMS